MANACVAPSCGSRVCPGCRQLGQGGVTMESGPQQLFICQPLGPRPQLDWPREEGRSTPPPRPLPCPPLPHPSLCTRSRLSRSHPWDPVQPPHTSACLSWAPGSASPAGPSVQGASAHLEPRQQGPPPHPSLPSKGHNWQQRKLTSTWVKIKCTQQTVPKSLYWGGGGCGPR